MERQWRWSMVALVIMAVVLQGSGGRVDADVLQPRLAAPSPEFLRYEASAQSGGGAAGLGLVPSPVDWSYLDGEHVMWLGGDAPLPASYDLRTEGRMTAVRDQGTSSACWTFATYGSLESTMMPAETLDFSENNLKNTSGFDYGPNTWGNGDMSTAYLTRWSGPISEADDPYDASSTTSTSGLSPIRHVQNVMILPQRPGPLDTADIKRALIDYGALVGSMYWGGDGWVDTAYYKLNTGAYYYAGSADSNHVVAVVGWDDAFPASNFSTPPPGNGAWIVKNSWGTAWGQSGYFFISYYDAVLFKKNPAYCFQAAEPADNYVHVYQYDPLGHTDSFGYGTTTAWEANVFAAAAAENVRAIGFYTLDVSCSYEAKVYGSWNGTTFSNLLSSTKGTIPSPGYHTIVLPSSGAPVASGQTFGVVVKLVTTNYRYPIAFEEPVAGYSMGATASTGQSYMSSNGATWTDVTGRYANTNVCVKAYAGTPSATPTLTCQVSPAGAGFVSASPPSADNAYSVGTVVTLTATPATGYTFTGWSGDLTGSTNPTTITMDADKTVTGTFVAVPSYTLTTTASPGLGGTIAKSPSQSSYASGTVVTLTATPSPGYTFTGWSGDLSGATNPTTITMSTNRSVTAVFQAETLMYTLTTTASPSAGGTISRFPNVASYASGTVVTLTAIPASGYTFAGWSGDLSGATNPTTITMSTNRSITATFTGLPKYTLTPSAGTGGTITPSTPQAILQGGSTTFTIVPSAGYHIADVSVDGVSQGIVSSYSFTNVTSNHTISARFEQEKKQTIIVLQIGNSMFTVNGGSVTLDSPPVIMNGRTLVPIRAIIEALGGTVGWDGTARKATVTLGSATIELWIGKNAARVNGANIPIDAANAKVVPEIINGRTMLPLRFVSENLGCSVVWADATKTITITYQP